MLCDESTLKKSYGSSKSPFMLLFFDFMAPVSTNKEQGAKNCISFSAPPWNSVEYTTTFILHVFSAKKKV